ncbi:MULTISPECIES: RsmB/NOP family class I SAM-dependent RNA methyltransferase [Streptococcus]|uniref:RsmF rRNA methyltransferase first C-terminal domain-containing protein n=1 Tax=Streptococcus ruminantium TaxID=1917441 RepID=A0ABU1B7G7_9STRE|nr:MULTISPECIES: RsmB/NOP family class I SAM-dependent RNA methyltransferase [Streptococcus]MDQ8758760.1 RsmF rRNA methyltransferase first C-terminal domain-containing protein [Streptococcus ruminantium]MDQ8767724.1 RsmF rRNA methyltransferase first C-terminal domain-containing protein [Streptococcus ruminantium]MDQ8768517.1 RsmF rRNA methyltransferase first C-terminal domain-containing protein [Streptococcus ruminantium]MDQ8775093.1 RsmF rRNA methyltransferase first C-terminal domain-containin
MQLPQDFIKKYSDLLGTEAQAFFEAFRQPAVSGFRTNPLKENQQKFEQPVPYMPWSYYGKISGKSPEHVTGLVYSQEPAAQIVGQVAAPEKGMKVLDLAAAPGGKTTHLLSYLDNTGLLVSNEISNKRAKILVENVERFGARNVVVTNESAERLAGIFPSYFDMIVLDAPCSGEGMFRKDPDAIQYWSKDYPAQCASLQRDILASAMDMLAPNGYLIYSTCTWAPEENEEIVTWLLEHYDLELVDIPKINGMVEGIAYPETARMYPHHFDGEGQFVAKFKYCGEGKSRKIKTGKSNLSREQGELWNEFSKKYLAVQLDGLLQVFGDNLYLLPSGLPDLSKIRIARNGLHLGVFKKKRFEPSFALGLSLHSSEVNYRVEISLHDFKTYVAGHPLAVSRDLANGWYQVAVQGNGLTFAKIVSGTLKNTFPKGLRF